MLLRAENNALKMHRKQHMKQHAMDTSSHLQASMPAVSVAFIYFWKQDKPNRTFIKGSFAQGIAFLILKHPPDQTGFQLRLWGLASLERPGRLYIHGLLMHTTLSPIGLVAGCQSPNIFLCCLS